MQSSAIHVTNIGQMIKEVEKSYFHYLDKYGISDPVVIVNNSGGKDSGATDLIAKVITGGNYRSVAADTGNEHPLTIDFLKSLHLQRGGEPVEIVSAEYTQEQFDARAQNVEKAWKKKQRVMAGAYRGILMPSLSRPDTKFAELWRKQAKQLGWGEFDTPIDAFRQAFVRSGNPFLDMSLIHGGFPLGRQRFCTDELKMQVVLDKVLTPLVEDGHDVVQWSGVRGEESEKRAGYDRFSEDKRNPEGQLFNFMPIHQWTASDVFACYRYFGVKPNELYKQGMGRVGCMPCILVKKEELAEITARFPEELDRVAQWEKQVAMVSRWMHWMIVGHIDRRQFFEYFTDNDGKRKRRPFRLGNKIRYNKGYVLSNEAYKGTCMLGPRGNIIGGTVWDAVDWSRTGRGGQVYDLVTAAIDAEACSSRYGLCE